MLNSSFLEEIKRPASTVDSNSTLSSIAAILASWAAKSLEINSLEIIKTASYAEG